MLFQVVFKTQITSRRLDCDQSIFTGIAGVRVCLTLMIAQLSTTSDWMHQTLRSIRPQRSARQCLPHPECPARGDAEAADASISTALARLSGRISLPRTPQFNDISYALDTRLPPEVELYAMAGTTIPSFRSPEHRAGRDILHRGFRGHHAQSGLNEYGPALTVACFAPRHQAAVQLPLALCS